MLATGLIVKSIAGHDKDRFYVVVKAEESFVWIADGKERKLEKPKRKNTKHIWPTKTEVDLNDVKTDKKLREALKPFNQALRAAAQTRGGN